jgi:ligand-binding SRPBCC domain-containing protein
MHIYKLEHKTLLPITLEEAWDFFSQPENLNVLTPDDLQFEILSDITGKKMYAGMIINYKISPFAGVKFNWTTEISHCESLRFFVDEQRFGPYSFWHHQHHFESQGGKVMMTDIVHYGLPFGPLGRLAHAIFVRQKLEHIFDYRTKKIGELWKK